MKFFVMVWFCIIFFISPFYVAGKDFYIYAPLSLEDRDATFSAHMPIYSILKSVLNREIILHYEENVGELVEKFNRGDVDFTFVCPTQYQAIKSKAVPMVALLERDNSSVFRCVLFTSAYGGKKSVNQIKSIAFTHKLSTCSYLSAYLMLNRVGINLDNLKYEYLVSPKNVIEGVILGKYDAGVIREAAFEDYKSLGLEAIRHSEKYPNFLLVANRDKVPTGIVDKVRERFLNLKAEEIKNLKLGRYGFIPYENSAYKEFEKFIPEKLLNKIIYE